MRLRVQGGCGACYAFASALVFSVRLCQSTKAHTNLAISEQEIVSCYHTYTDILQHANGGLSGTRGAADDGCGGGSALDAWLDMQARGRAIRSCNPYAAHSA
jgi:hypothetical protein